MLVIQEWWGLVPHIEDVVDRFAAEGSSHSRPTCTTARRTTEPDGAGKLMMALNIEQAAKDMSGAIALPAGAHRATTAVGVVGYCMGGGLALVLATFRPDAVQGLRAVLRRDPVAVGAARLVEDRGEGRR